MLGHHFGWADYLVLAAVLVLCLILGIIPACTGGKQKTTAEYLAGDRKLSLLPVAISLSVSFVSGITMLGIPAEIYYFSIQIIVLGIGTALGATIAAFTFLPVMYETQTSSVNKYLYRRFSSKTVQYLGTLFLAVNVIVTNAVVITGPAFFMETVSDLPEWAAVVLMGGLSTLYTCLGGLKAVVWTDALQAAIIYTGMLIVLIKGTIDTGSVQKTWDLYSKSGNLEFDFIPSPMKKIDIFTMSLIQVPLWVVHFGAHQIAVQRYTAMSSMRKARSCILMQIPCSIIFYTSSALCGVVAYGYYASRGCDPLADGKIHGVNQIIPYMVMDIMRLPGLPGLFFSGLFAGSLSNVSSSLVVFSQIMWEDLLSEKIQVKREITKTYILKALVVVAGALATAVTFIMLQVKGSLVQMVFIASASTLVPLIVLFFLATAWPLANNRVAILSSLLGCAVIAWISVGAQINTQSHKVPTSPIGTQGCSHRNSTLTLLNGTMTLTNDIQDYTTPNIISTTLNTTWPEEDPKQSWEAIYRISIYWYVFLGSAFGLLCGIILTTIPAFRTKDKIDERYIFPCLRKVFRAYLIQSDLVPTSEKEPPESHKL